MGLRLGSAKGSNLGTQRYGSADVGIPLWVRSHCQHILRSLRHERGVRPTRRHRRSSYVAPRSPTMTAQIILFEIIVPLLVGASALYGYRLYRHPASMFLV